MILSKTKQLTILIIFLFVACSVLLGFFPVYANGTKTTWIMDVPATQNQWEPESASARVVVFRLQRENDKTQPINIFVNKQYHASLLSEHQAAGFSVCPGNISLLALLGDQKNFAVAYERNDIINSPDLQAGNVYFYQVVIDDDNQVLGRWVDAEQAMKYVKNIKVQYHTVSRLTSKMNCPSSVYNISASTLFKLDRSDEKGLLPGAAANLKSLATQISFDFETINEIVVNGYADPMGNASHNMMLSEQRASTVVNQLLSTGLPVDTIRFQGLGSSKPVVADCKGKFSNRADIIECNQPNRRVEVEVYGIKRSHKGK
ncbi:MAG: OmpA family protein [Enterobacterales bacterium]|uniref:OmpA family protein n=1 Tax=Serratia sp. (in: enterobacteria) TaxID=616 RepID=UPI003F3A4BD0